MKFSILQQDLMPAISAVGRSCGIRSQLPVLGNVLISTDSGKLKLAATNLEVGVVKLIPAEVIEDGEVTVPAKTIIEVVANLGGEKIEFEATQDQVKISTPTFSSQMNGISASEFPAIPLTGKEEASIPPQLLLEALPQVAFASAVDEGRPILTGILTEIKGKKLQVVATDGYRLAHKLVPVEEGGEFKALIPRKTFEEVMRLISEEEMDVVKVSTSLDNNQIIFTLGNTQVSSRLIEGQFPAWEKIIPSESKARVVCDRVQMLKAVKLASVFARSESNIVKLQNQPGKLVLSSEAKELGSQKKELEASVEGEEIAIAFNTKYLQDVLSALNSSQVILELSGSLSAAILKPMGQEGLQYIIMPVNLS